MPILKQQLYSLCKQYLVANIKNAEDAIADARESAQNETKSSAGDKYETAREMMQQDIDLNTSRLNTLKAQQQVLEHIDATQQFDIAVPGSLVITNNGSFYIGVSAGKLMLDDKSYYAISIESPIGLQLRGKQTGDSFSLNGKEYRIVSIS